MGAYCASWTFRKKILDSLPVMEDGYLMNTTTWTPSNLKGSYISTSGTHTAQLRPAGFYAEFGCKLARHYAIRLTGTQAVIGTARTLTEAERFAR